MHRGWRTLWIWTDIDGQWFGYETEDEAYLAIGRHARRAMGISDELFDAMARAALGLPEKTEDRWRAMDNAGRDLS